MTTAHMDRTLIDTSAPPTGASASAVSWSAIFAGAAGAAALSLILVLLGSGLGFSSVSPWSQQGIGAATFGLSTILWITLTALVASGAGGYLAGRLRGRWTHTHTDEVYFRDTAHGFLAWAIATLVTAAVLTSAIGAIVGGGVKAGAAVTGAAASAASAASAAIAGGAAGAASASSEDGGSSSMGYDIDSLFRKPVSATPGDANAQPPVAEATRIFARSIGAGALSPEDQQYLGQLVAQRTGLSPDDAGKRVTDTFNRTKAAADDAAAKAKQAADTTRKAAAYGSLWLFVSLLIGAFVASLAATFGGRRRDL